MIVPGLNAAVRLHTQLHEKEGDWTFDNVGPWTGKVVGGEGDATPAGVEEAGRVLNAPTASDP